MLKIGLKTHLDTFPSWLKRSVVSNENVEGLREILSTFQINTVCQSARCPNIYECFSKNRCTFLILGKFCTRSCRFCAIETRKKGLERPQKDELYKIKEAVKKLGISSLVITSVTRDDLPDGGAGHFASCIKLLRELEIDLHIEVLVPDFKGEGSSIDKVILAGPEVFSHNLETVPRLYTKVRPQADYRRSLDVLRYAKTKSQNRILTKSGFMVGLGEFEEEIYNVMVDLRGVGCDKITIGQYLKPDPRCLKVEDFLRPEQFERFSRRVEELGFKDYSCGPFVRSSYVS